MLTVKQLQGLIHVDRSTIYRMAEAGRLPAVKVGRQWRFPADAIDRWLAANGRGHDAPGRLPHPGRTDLRAVLPLSGIQATADLFADIFGVMVIVSDMDGTPITEVSNPCGLFRAVAGSRDALDRCIEGWKAMGDDLDMRPRLAPSHLGFLCAHGFVRLDRELAGVLIVGGIAPENWPPPAEDVEAMAAELGVPPGQVAEHIDEVYRLNEEQQARILDYLPRFGMLFSRFAHERSGLVNKLEAIATLAGAAPLDQRSNS